MAGDDEARMGLLQRAEARTGKEEGIVLRRAAVVGVHTETGGLELGRWRGSESPRDGESNAPLGLEIPRVRKAFTVPVRNH